MQALLEAFSTRRSFDRLRGWSVHHAEVMLEAEDRIAPEVLVLDREGALHRWPLRWDWLTDDVAAAALGAQRLGEGLRALRGIAYVLTMPAWLADDGGLWVLGPEERPLDHEEVVVVAVGDRSSRELLVGLVHHRPRRQVAPWEHAVLGAPEVSCGRRRRWRA
jgi:hypothetical protein